MADKDQALDTERVSKEYVEKGTDGLDSEKQDDQAGQNDGDKAMQEPMIQADADDAMAAPVDSSKDEAVGPSPANSQDPDPADVSTVGAAGSIGKSSAAIVNQDLNAEDPMKLPPHGTELFVGGLPHAASAEEIHAHLSGVGELFNLHIPPAKIEGSKNPGYAFATYKDRIAAARAIEELGGKPMTGYSTNNLSVRYASKKKFRLYVCNIPRSLTGPQLAEALRASVPGVVEADVTMQKDQGKPQENRGFAFVEMYNHRAAEQAMRIMADPHFELNGQTLTPSLKVEWADSKGSDGDNAAVKSLYVSSLPDGVTEDQLRAALAPFGEVERVALLNQKEDPSKLRDYAFVHYALRSAALTALEAIATSPISIDGKQLTVAMAKPAARPDAGDRPGYGPRGGRGMERMDRPARGVGDGYGYGSRGGYEGYNAPYGAPRRGPRMDDGYDRRGGRGGGRYDDRRRGQGGYDDGSYGGPPGPRRGGYDGMPYDFDEPRGPPGGMPGMPVMMPGMPMMPPEMMMPMAGAMPEAMPGLVSRGTGGPVPRDDGRRPATGGYGSARAPATGGYGSGRASATRGYGAGQQHGAESRPGHGQRYGPY